MEEEEAVRECPNPNDSRLKKSRETISGRWEMASGSGPSSSTAGAVMGKEKYEIGRATWEDEDLSLEELEVNRRAELFIAEFQKQLRKERMDSGESYEQAMQSGFFQETKKKKGARLRLAALEPPSSSPLKLKCLAPELPPPRFLPRMSSFLPRIRGLLTRMRSFLLQPFQLCKTPPPPSPFPPPLPPKLELLAWDPYLSRPLQLQFRVECLVELCFSKSKLKKLWDDSPCLGSLKVIDISYSKNLRELPNLSSAPNLQAIRAAHCRSLTEIPWYILRLSKLSLVDVRYCTSLKPLPKLASSIEGLLELECPPLKALSVMSTVESQRHADEFSGKYLEKMQSWSDLPTRLDNISGEVLSSWEHESKLVDVSDDSISNLLISTTSRDRCPLVGMDARMEAVHALLGLESDNEVRVIGIWGIGGIGKTTLARYVYEQISQHFEACCFLENVKKIYQDNGPSGLQEEVSKNLQGALTVCPSDVGYGGIKAMLRHHKILLVADAVDKFEDLIVIPKDASWFGLGSRIIVITREKDLLLACGIKHLYEVKGLGYSEALRLFRQYAFDRSHPSIGFDQLSDRAVKLAGGLPLALQVFGSFLHGRVKDDWESALHRLEASIDKENVDRIKISRNELDEEDESISSNILTSDTASGFDGLVAMDRHMKAIYRLLDSQSNIEVPIIGIWGTGGVGKTTLVRYAYEKISRHFKSHCFLKHVKKIYQDHGPSGLQEEFLSKSLQGEAATIRSSAVDSDFVEARLGDRKVLLVADSVDNLEQLNAVAKVANWFGPGSVVIVATQDRSLLVDGEVKHVYEVERLRYDEALQLFSQFAFKQVYPSTGFEWLSVRAIQLAGFLPLALKVFGSFLCGKHEEDWESALHRIEASIDEDTLEIYKLGSKHRLTKIL